MSAQPHAAGTAVQGAPARSLSAARPLEETFTSQGPAPVLRALPKIRRRQKGLIGAVIALLALALTVVLAVNIHVANSQYEVVRLQEQQRSLSQQNQALTEQVQHLESPQALSSAAVGLGMVMPAEAAAFDLGSGEVIGSAEPADSGDRPSSFVASPAAPGQAAAPLDVAEQVEGAPSGILGGGALNTLAESTAGQNEQEGTADPRSRFDPTELNGGTIPAPSFD